jgi:hypothetical protein
LLVYMEGVLAAVMAPAMATAMAMPAAATDRATEVERLAAAAWEELLATAGYLLKGRLVRW